MNCETTLQHQWLVQCKCGFEQVCPTRIKAEQVASKHKQKAIEKSWQHDGLLEACKAGLEAMDNESPQEPTCHCDTEPEPCSVFCQMRRAITKAGGSL